MLKMHTPPPESTHTHTFTKTKQKTKQKCTHLLRRAYGVRKVDQSLSVRILTEHIPTSKGAVQMRPIATLPAQSCMSFFAKDALLQAPRGHKNFLNRVIVRQELLCSDGVVAVGIVEVGTPQEAVLVGIESTCGEERLKNFRTASQW